MAGSAIQLQQRVDDMVRMYGEGMTLTLVSSTLGFDRSTVLYHLRARGVQMRGRQRCLKEQSSEMARMYADGAKTEEIAATFGVHVTTIRDHAKRHGVKMRGNCRPWRLSPTQVDELVEMYLRNDLITAIAQHFKIDHSTVSAHLSRRGVPRRQMRQKNAVPKKPSKPKKIDNAERKMQLVDRLVRLRKTLDALAKAA